MQTDAILNSNNKIITSFPSVDSDSTIQRNTPYADIPIS